MNVVDDLAAFLLSVFLFFIADEVTVRVLPAMAYRDGPRSPVLKRVFTQTGRIDARSYSPLRQGFGPGCEQSCQKQEPAQGPVCVSHSWFVWDRADNIGLGDD